MICHVVLDSADIVGNLCRIVRIDPLLCGNKTISKLTLSHGAMKELNRDDHRNKSVSNRRRPTQPLTRQLVIRTDLTQRPTLANSCILLNHLPIADLRALPAAPGLLLELSARWWIS